MKAELLGSICNCIHTKSSQDKSLWTTELNSPQWFKFAHRSSWLGNLSNCMLQLTFVDSYHSVEHQSHSAYSSCIMNNPHMTASMLSKVEQKYFELD